MPYVYLTIAIVGEVIATSALKSANGFTRLGPSLLVVAGYGTAFFFLSLVLDKIPVGVAYAMWSGLGIVLVSVVSAAVFRQIPDVPALLGMGLIVAGVAVLNLWSKMSTH